MRIIAHALIVALVSLAACGGGADEAGDVEEGTEGVETMSPGGADTSAGAGGGTPASGQAIYAANCATCHGDGGRGDGPAAVGLEPPPADLTDGVWVTGDGSLPAIINVVANGSPGTAMIGWRGTLSDGEIEAVAGHVQSLGR